MKKIFILIKKSVEIFKCQVHTRMIPNMFNLHLYVK